MPLPRFDICVLPGDGIGVEVIDATLPLLEQRRAQAPASRCASRRTRPARCTTRRPAMRCPTRRSRPRARPTRSCSARWAGRRSATPTAPRSRRSSTCASSSSSTPACGRRGRSPASRCRSPTRARATSTSSSCANRPRACSPRAARARSTTTGGARHDGHHPRAARERVHDFAFRLARAAQARAAGRARHLRRQGQRVPLDGVLPQDLRRASPRALPDIEARHNYIDATALDLVRKPWDFDVLVTENMFGDILSDLTAGLVGGMGMAPSADIGDEHGAVPAVPRLGAGHRGPGQGQSDGDDPVGRDDARLARRAARRRARSRRRRAASSARSTRCSRRAAACRSSSAAATAPRRSPPPWPPTCEGRAVSKLRVAGVGAGYFSQFQYRGLAQHRGRRVSSASSTATRRRRARWPIASASRACFDDLDAMLDAAQPDLVDIITPPADAPRLRRAGASRAASRRSARSRSARPTPTRWRSPSWRSARGVPLRRARELPLRAVVPRGEAR